MYLSTIGIENFKNIGKTKLNLNFSINCLVGENGIGKTNFLDAIHFLCLTKSSLGVSDGQCVAFDDGFFRIEGLFVDDGKMNESILVECAFSSDTKKLFKCDTVSYDKLSEHIGKLPLVMIAPDDTDLIRDGSEVRRKFFDGILCQMDRDYLRNMLIYNHLVKQRNATLKQDRPKIELINVYDDKIIPLNQYIANKREVFISDFAPIFVSKYFFISSQIEKPSIEYKSDVLEEGFELKFKHAIDKDLAYQRTTLGIHTEDYEFKINNQNVKKTASQGQKKSFAIALKLAQFDSIKTSTSKIPILLLDDIFDKLDDARMKKLIELVSSNSFGQIFVTDARPERSKQIFGDLGEKVSFFDFKRLSNTETEILKI
ncbi:MAG: DNA replication/repair protein RecF [Cytophagales bacterium]